MHGLLSAVCLLIAGGVGALGVDTRIAWAAVFLAGLFMLIPV